MSAKQSRFSPKRPAGGSTPAPGQQPPKKVFDKEYDRGIFIDDLRSLEDVHLPVAKEWKVVRSFYEFRELLEEMSEQTEAGQFGEEFQLFVSFDHYLSMNPRERTGEHCIEFLVTILDEFKCQIDIQGHSKEADENTKKEEFWKWALDTYR